MIGMAGKRLRINLSARTWEQEEIPQNWVLNGVGGTGLALEAFFNKPASTEASPVSLWRRAFLQGPMLLPDIGPHCFL